MFASDIAHRFDNTDEEIGGETRKVEAKKKEKRRRKHMTV